MDLLRWMGRMFVRFVAVSVAILNAWMFLVNIVDIGFGGWTLMWILFSGLVGAAGGVAYLLSFDGPRRFMTHRFRLWGWAGMLAAVLLPTQLRLMLVPLVIVLIPTLFTVGRNQTREEPVTSA